MDLKDYARLARKRGWIVIAVALLAALSAFGFSKIQTPIYRSWIKLSVEPARASDYGQTLAIKNVLRNYTEQLKTRKMAQRVIDMLQLDITQQTFLSVIAVDSDEANYTIQIEARNRDGGAAQQIVQTMAQLFVDERQVRNIEVDQRDRILTSIIDSASPYEVFSPKTSVNVLAGGVLGVLLGALFVFALEWLESAMVRSAEDVERYVGVAVLGSIPTISNRESAQSAPNRAPRLAFWRQ